MVKKNLSNKQKRELLKKYSEAVSPELALKEAIRAEIQKDVSQLVNTQLSNAVEDVLYGFILTARDEFGFGKQRIERMMAGMIERTDAIRQGYLTREDIHNVVKEEVNFDFDEFICKYAKQ